MKTKMTILEASSLATAFSTMAGFIEGWSDDGDTYCWFRGVRDKNYWLRPGAYWRENYCESETVLTFAQEGIAFTNVGQYNSWDSYQLAQHHGIPTRLLDWTESFSAALFFALDKWDGNTTPAVFICQPYKLNETFLGWPGIIAPDDNSPSAIWRPREIAEDQKTVKQGKDGTVYDNDWPLAIYPKKGNRRIAAQQGVFTVHGRLTDGLIRLYEEKSGKDRSDAFARLDLNFPDKRQVLKQLKLLGVRRSAIYPDLDNLVKQIQEEGAWE